MRRPVNPRAQRTTQYATRKRQKRDENQGNVVFKGTREGHLSTWFERVSRSELKEVEHSCGWNIQGCAARSDLGRRATKRLACELVLGASKHRHPFKRFTLRFGSKVGRSDKNATNPKTGLILSNKFTGGNPNLDRLKFGPMHSLVSVPFSMPSGGSLINHIWERFILFFLLHLSWINVSKKKNSFPCLCACLR